MKLKEASGSQFSAKQPATRKTSHVTRLKVENSDFNSRPYNLERKNYLVWRNGWARAQYQILDKASYIALQQMLKRFKLNLTEHDV